MSRGYRSCEVTLEFGDGEHLFRLPLKRIGELEEKRGAGIGEIYGRVLAGRYHAEDLVETVRLGLIGGGMEGPAARKLIDRYCDRWPLDVWYRHALSVLSACVVGYGEPRSGEAGATGTDGSTSPSSTPSPSSEGSDPRP